MLTIYQNFRTVEGPLKRVFVGLGMNIGGNILLYVQNFIDSPYWKFLLDLAGGLTIIGGLLVVLMSIVKMIHLFFRDRAEQKRIERQRKKDEE